MAATARAMGEGACPAGLAQQIGEKMMSATEEPGMMGTPSMMATEAMATPAMMGTEAAMMGTMAAATEPVCLVAELSGAVEVPPGDPKGTGFAAISVDPLGNTVTFDVWVQGITLPAAAMHIHEAQPGVAGNIVVPADKAPDASGMVTTITANVDPALIQKIIANPGAYYFNVHNKDFPKGALRGQLETYEPADYGMMEATMAATMGK